MNMDTIMQELYKKIKLMDRKRFNKLLEELHDMYDRTHKDEDIDPDEYFDWGIESRFG